MWVVAKRVFLFVAVNALVLTSVSIVFNIAVTFFGLNMSADMTVWVMYSMLGMGGAFISLMLSKVMAKMMMGVKIIEPGKTSPEGEELIATIHRLARAAKLPKMPEVGIYESPEINAFATGPSKRNSLVAVSTGILKRMNKDELEGVLAHEVSHIANGDMVTMTLIQGVINTMVLILARAISSVIANQGERKNPWMQFMIFQLLQVVLSLLGSIVVCYFSRAREFRADKGGAKLAGREKMVGALRVLQKTYGRQEEIEEEQHASLATLKINGKSRSALAMMFATHPPLEERLRALQAASV